MIFLNIYCLKVCHHVKYNIGETAVVGFSPICQQKALGRAGNFCMIVCTAKSASPQLLS